MTMPGPVHNLLLDSSPALRGKKKVEIPPVFVALILKNSRLPYPNHGHVILANPSPIPLYRISSTESRCLVDVPGMKIPSVSNGDMAHYLKTLVASQIPHELYDAFITAIDEGNMKTMVNRSMPAAPYPTPGALLLGDAFNMQHPLTGGGMTVALSDIVVLRSLLRPLSDLNDASSLCRYLESFYTLCKPVPFIRCFVLHPMKKEMKCVKHVLII